MTWAARSSTIQVGDKVAYSASWLRSTGQMAGDIGHARGVVTGLKVLSEDVVLAEVDWGGDPEVPTKINVKNLARVRGKGFSHD